MDTVVSFRTEYFRFSASLLPDRFPRTSLSYAFSPKAYGLGYRNPATPALRLLESHWEYLCHSASRDHCELLNMEVQPDYPYLSRHWIDARNVKQFKSSSRGTLWRLATILTQPDMGDSQSERRYVSRIRDADSWMISWLWGLQVYVGSACKDGTSSVQSSESVWGAGIRRRNSERKGVPNGDNSTAHAAFDDTGSMFRFSKVFGVVRKSPTRHVIWF